MIKQFLYIPYTLLYNFQCYIIFAKTKNASKTKKMTAAPARLFERVSGLSIAGRKRNVPILT